MTMITIMAVTLMMIATIMTLLLLLLLLLLLMITIIIIMMITIIITIIINTIIHVNMLIHLISSPSLQGPSPDSSCPPCWENLPPLRPDLPSCGIITFVPRQVDSSGRTEGFQTRTLSTLPTIPSAPLARSCAA